MAIEHPENHSDRKLNLQEALFVLEGIDRERNLPNSVAIICFVISAIIGIRAFFLMSDLSLWGEVSEFVALMIASISWVLIFPIWILIFAFIMVLFNAMGLRYLRSVARNRLTKLTLTHDELNRLRDALGSRNWKHGKIIESVVADLATEKAGS
jgi:hypothetical protein